jgi:hypothetical protein
LRRLVEEALGQPAPRRRAIQKADVEAMHAAQTLTRRTSLALEAPSRVLMQRRPKSTPRLPSLRIRSSTRGPNPRTSVPKQASGSIALDLRSRRSSLPLQSLTARCRQRWLLEDAHRTRATTRSIPLKIPPPRALPARSELLRLRRTQRMRRRNTPMGKEPIDHELALFSALWRSRRSSNGGGW